uniref:Uncharacterized protein n=1 Tax=Globisporangium ultimum (strain ATCC 200006 / CBS 805.95 / DAOM BR144) TaxID=431595 RepID=K3WKL1_GLOUD
MRQRNQLLKVFRLQHRKKKENLRTWDAKEIESAIAFDLIGSTESISQLYRHFPLTLRPFFLFYKIKTVGDLSTMTYDQVKTFGIKDPVITVSKALDEFSGRKDRLKNIVSSPFR